MAGRQWRGRQRIPIQRIEDDDGMYATFSKRRQGLYKKASELSTLCGANVGIIIFSPTNVPYSFWHPSADTVIENHRNKYVLPRAESARMVYFNGRLDGLLDEKERLKLRERDVDEVEGDWKGLNLDGLDEVEVTEWKTYFTYLNSNVNKHLNQPEEELPRAVVSVGPSNFAPGPSTGDYYNVLPQTGGGSRHIADPYSYFTHFPQQGQGQGPSTRGFGESSYPWGDAGANE